MKNSYKLVVVRKVIHGIGETYISTAALLHSAFFTWLCQICCGAQNLQLQHMDPQFPDQEPNLCPLHWEHRVLAIGHQGSPCALFIEFCRYCVYKLQVCNKLAFSKSTRTIFPMVFAHFRSVCHSLVIGNLVILSVIQILPQQKKLTEGSDDG